MLFKPDSWILGRLAMVTVLVVFIIWGTWLVGADGSDAKFEVVVWGIILLLSVMVGGKGWKDFSKLRWGSSAQQGKKAKEEAVE